MKNKNTIAGIVVLAVVAAGAAWLAAKGRPVGLVDTEGRPASAEGRPQAAEEVAPNGSGGAGTVDAGAERPAPAWKAYASEKYGFEFKYPENCRIVADESLADIVNVEECNFTVSYYDSPGAVGEEDPDKADAKAFADLMRDPGLSGQRKTDFQGNEAFEATFENKEASYRGSELFVSRGGHVYDIGYALSVGDRPADTDTPRKILETFRFTR
jgi:hypothetical protein